MKHFIGHIIFGVVCFMILPYITYSCFVDAALHDKMEEHLCHLDSIHSIQLKDTTTVDSLQFYYHKIQEMRSEMMVLKNHYASDVNLMIEKTDAWFSYWIGVFAIVMAIPAILFSVHYFRAENKRDEKFKEVLRELESEKSDLQTQRTNIINELNSIRKTETTLRSSTQQRMEHLRSDFDQVINSSLLKFEQELNEEIQNSKDKTECEIKILRKSIKENRISSIMMCLSSFPDPQMVSEKSEKRMMVSGYLLLLYKEFSDYSQIVCSQVSDNRFSYIEILQYVRLVLLSIKLAVIRSQSTFSELNQDIAFHSLIQIIDTESKAMFNGQVPPTELQSRIRNIQNHFLQVVEYIRV